MTQTITADAQSTKQQDLLQSAKQFLAGGGLGHFRLPDEVDIVLASASGQPYDRRNRQGVHRLRAWLRAYADRPCQSFGHRGRGRANPQRHLLFSPQRTRNPTRPEAGRKRSLRGAGPVSDHRDRGYSRCAARRASLHGPGQDPEIRGRLARHARLFTVGNRASSTQRLSELTARLERNTRLGRQGSAGRPV